MEGIVLRAIPFKERDKIITLITPAGMLKLYVKGKRKLDLTHQALTSTFTRGEYLYNVRKSELYRFVDGSVIDQYLPLRNCLDKLMCATKMVDALLKTQWPNNPSPELYQLFACFLKKTCETPHLFTPFLIKLLKHEGVLQPEGLASIDAKQLHLIANTRSMQELENLLYEPSFSKKIEALFEKSTLS